MTQITLAFIILLSHLAVGQTDARVDRKLFVYGGQVTKEFIKYTAELTGKKNPKIGFLPTATGDHPSYIKFWNKLCADLPVEPIVIKAFISSGRQSQSFEEIIMSMDAIIVGGGNTLNMLAIWKAQEIDVALKKAYDSGIIIAGGSAGSLCWFNGGTTDSRPKELSIVEGLGFLNFSHCPHYHSETSRRPLYHKNILEGKLSDGYACDDMSGIFFLNEEVHRAIAMNDQSYSYFVFKKDEQIVEEQLDCEIID